MFHNAACCCSSVVHTTNHQVCSCSCSGFLPQRSAGFSSIAFAFEFAAVCPIVRLIVSCEASAKHCPGTSCIHDFTLPFSGSAQGTSGPHEVLRKLQQQLSASMISPAEI
ncbi:unnamed protein product [Polarella glacialis]|uniref:Uncharacterized protein n=1 Tax=Polarella glacialis TaxID=89957 RepID=A0A813DG23_POLGL|nr:unnamed protein product [Polarella glacialis]